MEKGNWWVFWRLLLLTWTDSTSWWLLWHRTPWAPWNSTTKRNIRNSGILETPKGSTEWVVKHSTKSQLLTSLWSVEAGKWGMVGFFLELVLISICLFLYLNPGWSWVNLSFDFSRLRLLNEFVWNYIAVIIFIFIYLQNNLK